MSRPDTDNARRVRERVLILVLAAIAALTLLGATSDAGARPTGVPGSRLGALPLNESGGQFPDTHSSRALAAIARDAPAQASGYASSGSA
jgi:membrane-associated phospholipid phosphatase